MVSSRNRLTESGRLVPAVTVVAGVTRSPVGLQEETEEFEETDQTTQRAQA